MFKSHYYTSVGKLETLFGPSKRVKFDSFVPGKYWGTREIVDTGTGKTVYRVPIRRAGHFDSQQKPGIITRIKDTFRLPI